MLPHIAVVGGYALVQWIQFIVQLVVFLTVIDFGGHFLSASLGVLFLLQTAGVEENIVAEHLFHEELTEHGYVARGYILPWCPAGCHSDSFGGDTRLDGGILQYVEYYWINVHGFWHLRASWRVGGIIGGGVDVVDVGHRSRR